MIPEKIEDLFLPYPGRDGRAVRVYVPAHEEGETFPVIYMTDGQNVFEDDNVKYGCWYTREAVRAKMAGSGRGAVIVGIDNEGDPLTRANDLTPASIGEPIAPEEVKKAMHLSGETFDDFVINTVMPAVEKAFPVKKGRENTAFCGSSSGVLMTFFSVMTHPDKFGAAGVFSPCFMIYNPMDLGKWIDSVIGDEKPFLYLYSGAGDDMEKAICHSTEWTYAYLKDRYPAEKMKKLIKPENEHKEYSWAETFKVFLDIFLG